MLKVCNSSRALFASASDSVPKPQLGERIRFFFSLSLGKPLSVSKLIPLDKMPISLYNYGNTSGASPIISLIESYKKQNNKEINVMFAGFGIGLSWGVFSAKLNTANFIPIIEDDSIFEEGIIKSPNELYAGLKK